MLKFIIGILMFFTTSSFAHTQSELDQLASCSLLMFTAAAMAEDKISWAKDDIKYYNNLGRKFSLLLIATVGTTESDKLMSNEKIRDNVVSCTNLNVCRKKCETLYYNW